jgi:AraC family transcriptional regulator, regulatory protein of adaptative response / methylated-DNA-[protein]-cysteine methyltransferase
MDILAATNYEQLSQDYRRIEQAIEYIEANQARQPSLKEIADSLYLSEFHFQRLFTRWAGVSPKRFLQYLNKEEAKKLLDASGGLLEAAYEVGLSGPARLHDLFLNSEGVTPGQYKNRGEGLTISYGYHPTPFGECLIGVTEKGICSLAFLQDEKHLDPLEELRSIWPKAELKEAPEITRPFVGRIFSMDLQSNGPLIHLHLTGTNFQLKVWEALLRVPSGTIVTYKDLAVSIGAPESSRAVSNAVARNPIPVLIPCHRVIRKQGEFGGYRYGPARKKAMLAWELTRGAAQASQD